MPAGSQKALPASCLLDQAITRYDNLMVARRGQSEVRPTSYRSAKEREMRRLRITQSKEASGGYRVDLEFEAEKAPRQTATSTFDFSLAEQDQADLRWYLEDFLQFPQDPAPKVAARVEQRMVDIGKDLFVKVFHSSNKARDEWAKLREKLDETHVEIVTSVEGATAILWELIRDPTTDIPLALRAAVFARAHPESAQQPELHSTESGPIRILLVICRPRADDDVPFRSVASRLIKGLSEQNQASYQLDVLRPPTFEQLARVLRQAKVDGKPYHVVHFDGHGMYAELTGAGHAAQVLEHLFPVTYSALRTGRHGFLLFENPQHPDNVALVDGPTLGNLLVETDVPVLVLNACRSAHGDVEPEQGKTGMAADPDDAPQQTEAPADPHERVRALGSLAQEVMDAGVAGVVAMRYNVYVVTAAQFVADLYAELAGGQTLGAAATMGRKQLYYKPDRAIAYDPRPLQDWCVPVVYESMPIGLFPIRKQADGLTISIQAGDTASGGNRLDKDLPRPPDAGFFGRDETLLALDRSFDAQPVVLLHAYAGSGKTSTAAEFARWYSQTGGIRGPVLFTSFEHSRPLPRVLDQLGQVFGRDLERQGVHWLALGDADRRDVALQVLKQVPVLWIWDNVEPIAGFTKGTPSILSDAEQRELADFLRDARSTRARFLLTSRRDERDWLGDLPRRVLVPPMPMQERVQLARALAEKHGHRITDVEDWTPLLRFTAGNPLTITVLVGQVLRDGLTSKAQIDEFVTELYAGTAKFDDEASEGRSRSLGASLSYGFDRSFGDDERKQLALLHFFQGFVNVDVLRTMGHSEGDWCLPEVRGLTREAGIALLDRAADIGLLTALGGGYYTIHPAGPWFFKSLPDTHHAEPAAGTQGAPPPGAESRAGRPLWAFVCAMDDVGKWYYDRYNNGERGVIAALAREEANLLHARRLAIQNGWWLQALGPMQGLYELYDHQGRRAEWKRLVDEIEPSCVNPVDDGPRPGLEFEWLIVTGFRARLAIGMRDWTKAERLLRLGLDRIRRSAEETVDRHSESANPAIVTDGAKAETSGSDGRPPSPAEPTFRDRLAAVLPSLSAADRRPLWALAGWLDDLGEVHLEIPDPACIASFAEALDLDEQLGYRTGAATCAFKLGTAFKNIPAVRDLDQAERYYRRSLELYEEGDRFGRAKSLAQLGAVELARFDKSREAGIPEALLFIHLKAAHEAYRTALDLLPADAVSELAVANGQLGQVHRLASDIEGALPYFREAIRYEESQGNTYGASAHRYNMALGLGESGRLQDAREYTLAARDGFASCGPTAAGMVQMAEELIKKIDEYIAEDKG
jgi:tetratricopeptide (TPR) repeat protein